jgi:mitochondrial fission process protein 1
MPRTVEAAQEKVNEFSDRNADTTDSDIRYLAYGARLRTALRASTRYIAYVGDPNFMFFVHPYIV